MTENIDQLQYPIGKFQTPQEISKEDRERYIQTIRELPQKLREAVNGLNVEQLDTQYREGGWTLRQVVHHLADSHTNANIRFRLALTEDHPTVKGYLEAHWAELSDARHLPVEVSLKILEGTHQRWTHLMSSMTDEEWKRTFFHSQYNRTSALDSTLALYAWHSKHHVAHISALRARKNW